MPSDTLPVLLSTGVSFGLLAGIVSGVCYLVANGFSWQSTEHERRLKEAGEKCPLCGINFEDDDWRCRNCVSTDQPRMKFEEGGWFLKQVSKGLSYVPWSMSFDSNLNNLAALEGARERATRARLHVRDFLESLGARLAGGSLDHASVSRMYAHPDYEAIFVRYHTLLRNALAALARALHAPLISNYPQQRDGTEAAAPVSVDGESASTAHVRLKRLVARVFAEAASLPALSLYARAPPHDDFQAKTYEDLLATAILNKVIDRYQQEYESSNGASSGIHTASASASEEDGVRVHSSPEPLEDGDQTDASEDEAETVRRIVDKERNWTTDDVQEMRRYSSEEDLPMSSAFTSPVDGALSTINFAHEGPIPFPEYGGDIINIDSSNNDAIEFHARAGSDQTQANAGDIQASNISWEENWLFQRKKIKTVQSVPVPMLVPNSNTEYRALIGDRDAEDTTDLSEVGSDSEDEHEVSDSQDLKSVLLKSKTVIGGKTPVDSLIVLEDADIQNEAPLPIVKEPSDIIPVEEQDVPDKELKAEVLYNNVGSISETIENNIVEPSTIVLPIDSGPAPVAEFSVIEIHRGLSHKDLENLNDYNTLKSNFSTLDISSSSVNATDEFDISMNKSEQESPRSPTENSINEATNFNVLETTDRKVDAVINHQKDGEYTETIALPVQRYADSLRRQHYNDKDDKQIEANGDIKVQQNTDDLIDIQESKEVDENVEDDGEKLIPGSIAERERMKWLNSVPMPNNPYSAEAIQKRLSGNSVSAIFDILTSQAEIDEPVAKNIEIPDEHSNQSAKVLKDVLAGEVPQYKRFGRDYYINEAKRSAGARKRYSDISSDKTDEDDFGKRPSSENYDVPEFSSPHLLIQRFNAIANGKNPDNPITQDEKNVTDNKFNPKGNFSLNILNDIQHDNNNSIFSATPVIIEYDDEDFATTEKKFQNLLNFNERQNNNNELNSSPKANNRPTSFYSENPDNSKISSDFSKLSSPPDTIFSTESISSLEDSLKVYNIPSGKIINNDNLGDDSLIQIEIQNKSEIDEGKDGNDNIVIKDKNDFNSLSADKVMNHDSFRSIDNGSTILLNEGEGEEIKMPKVKDLVRKFFVNDNQEVVKPIPTRRKLSKDNEIDVTKNSNVATTTPTKNPMHMHSLTARSISREFREELKLSMPTIQKIPGGTNEVPDGMDEPAREERSSSPLPAPGTLKNKLAFFENLKKK